MAKIQNTSETKVFSISKWLGVNENPDGDTKLQIGEASTMRNWRVTKDGHLQIRPGYGVHCDLGTTPVLGMWNGYIKGNPKLIASCGGKLYEVDGDVKTEIGLVEGNYAHFFGFAENLYLLTGSKYYVYDGTELKEVEGYRPLISISNVPTGGGTGLEQVNKLTGTRRAWFSPDGSATTFQLPEKNIESVDYVKKTADDAAVAYTADLVTGVVTITPALADGTNSIEIGWTYPTNYRSQVEAMRFSETYNGSQDTRLFVYGDGSNKAFYTGLDHDGQPTAEYFPDLNEIAVDSANTPITAMIKHYDRLLTFKTDGAFITTYGNITLVDNTTTASFYTTPLNREIGNVALGQAVLVKNNPYTLFGRSAYEWQLSSYASKDERNAKSKSDKVGYTLGTMSLSSAICFDDEYSTEYYICQNGKCVVYNYTAKAWYIYDNIPATCFISIGERLFFGTPDGKIMYFARRYRNDNGAEIDALWKSGAMDFRHDFRSKYASDIWVSAKPEYQSRVAVTVQSDRKSDYTKKVVASNYAVFTPVDFEHYSFCTNKHPQIARLKIKVKKFAFYYLVFSSLSSTATVTILNTDIKIRYAGNVK